MKFLEYTPLERMNEFLSHLNLGERTIRGYLEPYSCKHTGTDKKLSLSLENEMVKGGLWVMLLSAFPVTWQPTIQSFFNYTGSVVKSAVNAHQFFTEESWDSFKQIFDSYMFEASRAWIEENEGSSLLETLYKALDEVVKLSECEIYSYDPDSDADPSLEKGAIWSFNFFFYNRKLKRVVSFRFCCFSNLVAEGFLMDDSSYEEDGEIFDDMDM
ncbi:hypothetical protein NC653_025228 [Populus alba x Populus x berolinensis]|uniref:Repressor of RNA polymerase III transcription n=1 Tax=Populus alba x Populus x berolinensis TaxID=444605 RepID=A0AAD6Q7R5_9ROSI|nr:hypothetical protein NC653_025228 [Populus alba x Populus x berolinensis]